ncbi:CdaR family protein [Sporosarcina sp. ACRSL]|uniref:CdaR family protein n=1 Tax=Sporosarcina sp. ACRSL TaxID=2918215 RepID=UPI001EF4CCA5|nr:CdaR family protein [Sporosarcina sp. ACRSL]MCG7343250.1 CdaR family protein [Sporosarcina sp. ACRSL]
MDKLMDRPWFLRFTALALAIILFFSVRAEGNNTSSSTIGDTLDIIRDVPVEVYYDNENLVVTGVPKTVNMTIDGPSNIVQTTKLLKDFILKVDLRSLPMGRHTVRIQAENLSDKLDVRLDPATVDVVIEEKISRAFPVEPEFNERLLKDGFHAVKKEVEPATIQVTGAKSVIESISFVKVSATGDNGINKSFEQKARVRVLDRDLNKLNVTIDPEEVTVKVEVEENNKEVPIVLRQRGVPGENVAINSIFSDTKTVRLYGPKKTLDAINEIRVDVDVSNVEQSETVELTLPKPRGVSKLSEDKVKVNISVTVINGEDPPPEVSIGPAEEENVNVDVTKEFKNVPVAVKGLDEKYKSSFLKPEDGVVDVTITAKEDVINSLDVSDLDISVDASNTDEEGEHAYPITVVAPNNIAWKLSEDEVTLEIKLA